MIDDRFKILLEYQNKTSPRKGKGVGDMFVQWALRNSGHKERVHQVAITEVAADQFAEFPAPALEPTFDPPDRKFAAVANAHASKPPIWQASDCKWMDWHADLGACGIKIDFLCKSDVCAFYQKKFPGKPVPAI